MSFNQIGSSGRASNRMAAASQHPSSVMNHCKQPKKAVAVIHASDPEPVAPQGTRKRVVLHGRLVRDGSTDSWSSQSGKDAVGNRRNISSSSRNYSNSQQPSHHQQQRQNNSNRQSSVRAAMTRKSHFSSLTTETTHFQKMVADLENILLQSGESPEMAWRAKILMTSATATDQELWDKLHQYEKSLTHNANHNNNDEMRTAQSACMKLHRDFKRSHKALVMAISLHEKKRNAEISQLGAVGWSQNTNNTNNNIPNAADEDFFDRAMRQDELNNINRSMHQVKEMYEELGELVVDQQEDIDILEDNILNSSDTVRQAAQKSRLPACLPENTTATCSDNDLVREGMFGCGAFDYDTFARSISLSMGGEDDDNDNDNDTLGNHTSATTSLLREETKAVGATEKEIRVGEPFHWKMPFETIQDDLKAVKADILGLGTDLATTTASKAVGKCGPDTTLR